MASLLPLPDDPRYQAVIDAYPTAYEPVYPFPRSVWLAYFEDLLRQDFPNASSRERKLTARHYAPFPLQAGKDVP